MNSDIIRLLPDSVANQIAAGEVIQRPASVIKELVENAVDAGGTEITIVVKDAGRTLIQVVDNGSGMSPTDARMAFERHATSKISSATDLYSLHTMGFRGEALPSIASVAQIDLRTMRPGDTVGTRLELSGSRFEAQEPVSCVPGTNLSVKNLFFNYPARRKFLKKDSVELGHILREFERLALVNSGIAFTLIHNDVTIHSFGPGTFKQRIGALFGKGMESQLAEISTETSLVKINGFIGLPRYAKKRGFNQFFFVNGRNMRHPAFHRALMNCYEQLVPAQSQPSYFINFQVDPATIDVNIHPQKHEIKFEHEQAIMQILLAAVRETLGKAQAAGALDFESDQVPDIPLFDPSVEVGVPDDDADNSFNPFENMRPASDNSGSTGSARLSWNSRPSVPTDWETLYSNFERRRDEAMSEPPEIKDELFETPAINDAAAGNRSCFQLHNGYIVSPSRTGVLVVSQHRAHVRILYDKFLRQLAEGPLASQQLIFAEELDLMPAEAAVAEAASEVLVQAGFELLCADGRWTMNSVPAVLAPGKARDALMNILDDFSDGMPVEAALLHEPVALAMARSGAISGSAPLTQTEMDTIIADLMRCPDSSYTPDGLLIMTLIDTDEIARRLQ